MPNMLRVLLAFMLAVPLVPLRGQDRNTVNRLLNRIVQHEQEFLNNLRADGPIVETYTQEIPASDQPDTLPTKDHYFLGRMTLTDELNYESFLTRTDNQPGPRLPFAKNQATAFFAKGFAQMTIPDASNFNHLPYNFDSVPRDLLAQDLSLLS